MSDQPSARGRLRALAAVGILVLAVFGTFGRTANWSFLSYDDNIHIVRNPWLNPPSWESLEYFWRTPYWGEYVPLTYSLWVWEAQVGERDESGLLKPWLFHFVNVVLHAMAVVAVFLLLKELTGTIWPAMLGGLVFGLHPLQAEAVCWISETRGLLSGFFGVVAIWAYVLQARSSPQDKRWATLWYAIASSAFVFALLAKSSAVAVVPIVAVIDVMQLKRRWAQVAFSLTPWALAAAGMALMMTSQQGLGSIAFRPPWSERCFMAGDAIAFYLGKLVWPTKLCADYGWYPQYMREQSWFHLLGIVPVCVFAVALLVRRYSSLLLCLLVFVAALSPVLGFVPFTYQSVSLVADRFAYLAMLGPALLLARLTMRLHPGWIFAIATVVVSLLGTQSWHQTRPWRTDLALAIHTREVNRRSIFAASTIAQQMMRQGEQERALELCLEIAQLNPHSSRALINLAQFYSFYGQNSAAIDLLQSALTLHSTSSLAHRLLAECMEDKGQLDQAVEHYRLAQKYGRQDENRIVLQMSEGSLLMRLERYPAAAEVFSRAIDSHSSPPIEMWLALAQARLRSHEDYMALEATRRAEAAIDLSEKGSAPEIYVAIAQMYYELDQREDALRLGQRAIDIYRQFGNNQSLQTTAGLLDRWRANPDDE